MFHLNRRDRFISSSQNLAQIFIHTVCTDEPTHYKVQRSKNKLHLHRPDLSHHELQTLCDAVLHLHCVEDNVCHYENHLEEQIVESHKVTEPN